MGKRVCVTLLLSTATLGSTSATRSTVPGQSSVDQVRSVQQKRRETAALRLAPGTKTVVDGRLDESYWQDCVFGDGFVQRAPFAGEPAAFASEFCVACDDEALYVAVRAADPEPQDIAALLTRRDESSASDWLWVSIDGNRDRRTASLFALNAASVQRDLALYGDGGQEDASWNAVWTGASAITARGWNAEFRIPLSQLRFSGAGNWGFQVGRFVQRTQEESFWAPRPAASPQRVSLYGDLTGMHDLNAGGGLVLTPQGLLGGAYESDYSTPGRFVGNFGGDFQYNLSSSFTLVGTLNPDFGQVEADPSEVNLTEQESFFAEKRPFFLENFDLFRLSLSQGDGGGATEGLFYSRRIGAPPHGSLDTDEAIRTPDNTSIYGASKLTGTTASGWGVGLVNAVTAEEGVDIPLEGEGPTASADHKREILEPLTNYTAIGARKSYRAGRSNVSGLLTGVQRRLKGTGLDLPHSQAYSAGLAYDHRFADDTWFAQAKLTVSHVRGSATSLDETQRSSVRYFQRPDADHLQLDPERTSLSGFGAQYMLVRSGGTHLRGGFGGDTRSPGFEVNDLGFQRTADQALQWVWAQWRKDKPGAYLRDWNVNANFWGTMNYGKERTTLGGDMGFNGRLLNYWSANAGLGYEDNYLSTRTLRGGPAVRGYPAVFGWFGMGSDGRRAVKMNVNIKAAQVTTPRSDSWNFRASGELAWQMRSNFDLRLATAYSRRREGRQYVDTVTDVAGAPRYIVGKIEQETADLTLRANYTFSPTLSVQAYAQLFASAGRYFSYSQAADLRAKDPTARFRRLRTTIRGGDLFVDSDGDGLHEFDFSPGDFGFRQLRANLVARWEYAPGSTAFFVWSHSRTDEGDDGRFKLDQDLRRLWSAPGNHVLLVKVAYRFEA